MKLLSREAFRTEVFRRDGGRCVVPGCTNPAEDAHHIIERKLWPDGGYYLENGASLCDLDGAGCHKKAEDGEITPKQLREWCKIDKVALPPNWDDTMEYTKWGKATWSGKYPHTLHLPFSSTIHADDSTLQSMDTFHGERLIVTEKMDGENTTMMRTKIHARSLDSATHASQSWVRSLWGRIKHDLPYGWRLHGENTYAVHSVEYSDLESYFLLFAVSDSLTFDEPVFLSWDETVMIAEYFEIPTVPVLYDGFSLDQALKAWTKDPATSEGYVIRLADQIPVRNWPLSSGKYVRENHVQTEALHWRHRNDFGVNKLAGKI